MIHEITYTKEWIEKKSNEYKRGKKKADPMLIEKITKALHLLEELAKSELAFIFKGGTSLLLLLNQMHRFSIDIDIIIEKSENEVDIEKVLVKMVEESDVFTHFEENVRQGDKEIPKAHYKFSINPYSMGKKTIYCWIFYLNKATMQRLYERRLIAVL